MVCIPGVDRIADPLQSTPVEAPRGAETILVVEDSHVVRKMTRDLLESRGYRVIDAASGEEALNICQSYSGNIDLILTDVVMSRMSGRELAESADRVRPGIKVLLMSGYADESVDWGSDPEVLYLKNPFSAATLLDTVKQMIACSSSPLKNTVRLSFSVILL